jgi:hypothetical protein
MKEEIKRICENNSCEKPESMYDIIGFKCTNPQKTLARVKTFYKQVLEVDMLDDKTITIIRDLLPDWLEGTIRHYSDEDIDYIVKNKIDMQGGPWILKFWLESIYEKEWEWWSSLIDEEGKISIVLKISEWPYSATVLFLLFIAQGCEIIKD